MSCDRDARDTLGGKVVVTQADRDAADHWLCHNDLPIYEAFARHRVASASVEAGDGWQPIETAPKDGTAVLLWTDSALDPDWKKWAADDDFAEVQIGQWEPEIDAPMLKREAGWQTPRVGVPTHWRPLPAPPVALSASEGGR